jgi:hypothetical protein
VIAFGMALPHHRSMRFAVPLCALLCAVLLPLDGRAAIALEHSSGPAEPTNVGISEYAGGSPQQQAKQHKFRLEEQKRARMKRQVRGIVMIVAPVALIVLVTGLFMRARSEKGRRRSTHRKLKQAEVRRRAGGPEQLLDPRQW